MKNHLDGALLFVIVIFCTLGLLIALDFYGEWLLGLLCRMFT